MSMHENFGEGVPGKKKRESIPYEADMQNAIDDAKPKAFIDALELATQRMGVDHKKIYLAAAALIEHAYPEGKTSTDQNVRTLVGISSELRIEADTLPAWRHVIPRGDRARDLIESLRNRLVRPAHHDI